MSPIYYWAHYIKRIGFKFSWAELRLAVNQIRRGCDTPEGWRP